MRHALLAVVVAMTSGCGRIAFDPRSDASVEMAGDMAGCPSGYVVRSTGCYRPEASGAPGTASWLEAEAFCEADGIGSHLVVLDAPGEAEDIKALIPSTNDYWVGASDLATEGVFLSVTNGPFGFSTWQSGEPDGGTAESCIAVTNVPEMYTFDCVDGNDFVCEYDGIPAVPAAWGQ